MPSRSRTTPQDNHASQKYGPPMPPVDGSPSPRPSRATKFASALSGLVNSFVRRLRRKKTKRLQQPASSILTVLPIELIIEVMKHLGCREVLRLRQLLRALSATRLVWENLVQRTALDSEVPLKLERPLKLYSAVQLEGLALQWRRVDLGWTRPPERCQVPQRDIRTNGAVNFYLVEGGRWLLIATRNGAIVYYDLEDPRSHETTLIRDQLTPELEQDKFTSVLMDVDLDTKAPVLTFNLGLSIRRQGHSAQPSISLIQVWNVHLVVDSNGRGTSLRVTNLASFPGETHSYLYAISLLGKAISYGVMSANDFPGHVAIVDWAEAQLHCRTHEKSLSYNKLVIHTSLEPRKIRLLPGRRLLTAYGPSLHIYDQLSAQRTNHKLPIDTEPSYTPHIWSTYLHELNDESLSKPFLAFRTDNIRLVVCSRSTVYGIIVPSIGNAVHPNYQAKVVKLMDYRPGPMYCRPRFGYHHAIIPIQLVKQFSCDRWCPLDLEPTMDEQSGRAVVSALSGRKLVVLEFASDRIE